MRTSKWIKMISVPLALAALSACSDGNGSVGAVIDGSGKHAVGTAYTSWVQQHWVEYKKANGGSGEVSSATSCSECHGADLAGGSSKVSCFSVAWTDSEGKTLTCHPNYILGHPSAWIDPTSSSFHGRADFNGKAVRGSTTLAEDCGLCHATAAGEVSVGLAPSCLSTDPSYGIKCHSSSPAVTPQGCTSCHAARPTGPNASTEPNRTGAHPAHMALGVGCKACHRGGGTGTDKHAAGNGLAYLNLSTGYKAQTGTFGYAAGTCAAVSCHGGKTTPNWRTGGTITFTQCGSCHQAADNALPQYNQYASGAHNWHLANVVGIQCVDCHTVAEGTHFTGLATPLVFETTAASTVSSANIQSYNPSTGACITQNGVCHTGVFPSYTW